MSTLRTIARKRSLQKTRRPSIGQSPSLQLESLEQRMLLSLSADAGGAYSIFEDGSLPLNASNTDLDGGTANYYYWDLDNDGFYLDHEAEGETVTLPVDYLRSLGMTNDGEAYPIGLEVHSTKMEGFIIKLPIPYWDTDSTTVTINNRPPTADAGGPYAIDEGQPLWLDASGSTDPGNDSMDLYSWTIDGNTIESTSPTLYIPWEQLEGWGIEGDGGTLAVQLHVTDSDGGVSENEELAITELVVNNVAPVADAGGPYMIHEGAGVTLNGSGSYDINANDDGVGENPRKLDYAWEIGVYANGVVETYYSVGGNTETVALTWADLQGLGLEDDGTPMAVRLTVTDPEDVTGVDDSLALVIQNLAPEIDGVRATGVNTGGPGYMLEGDDLRLVVRVTDPGGDPLTEPHNILWDIDGDGVYDDASATNYNPELEGYSAVVPWEYLEQLVLPNGNPLPSNGHRSITIGVMVDDGEEHGIVYGSTELTIRNAAPEAVIAHEGPYVIYEGEDLWLSALGSSDPNANDEPLVYEWNINGVGWYETDAEDVFPYSAHSAIVRVPWEWLENLCWLGMPSDGSPISMGLRVTDSNGATDETTSTLIIKNVDPVADAGGPYMITEGEGVWLNGGYSSDVNDADEGFFKQNLNFEWFLGYEGNWQWAGPGFGSVNYVTWQELQNLGLTDDGTSIGVKLVVTDPDFYMNRDIKQGIDLAGFGEDGFGCDCSGIDAAWSFLVIQNDKPDIQEVSAGNAAHPWELSDPGIICEGQDLLLSVIVTDPGNDPLTDAHSILWDLDNDGVYDDASATLYNPETGEYRATVSWDDLEALGLKSDAYYKWFGYNKGWKGGNPISVRVDDLEEHGVNYENMMLYIKNVEPVAEANGPYIITEGEDLWLSALGSFDINSNDEPLTYEWNIDGQGWFMFKYETSPDNVFPYDEHSPVLRVPWSDSSFLWPWSLEELCMGGMASDGSEIELGLRVTDADGAQDTTTTTLIIKNADPVADAGGPYVIMEGQGLHLDAGRSYDINRADQWKLGWCQWQDQLDYWWDLDNDGKYDDAHGKTVDLTWDNLVALGLHETWDDGTSLVVGLLVIDPDAQGVDVQYGVGGQIEAANFDWCQCSSGWDTDRDLLLVIQNVTPSVDAGGPYTITEGENLELDGSGSDPGNDPLTFLWDLDNDGAFDDAATATPLVPWRHLRLLDLKTDGTENIIALMVDDGEEHGVNVATTTLIINNVAPAVDAGEAITINEGDVAHFYGSFTDPYGDLDGEYTYRWDFGDIPAALPAYTEHADHQYLDDTGGPFTATFYVTDKDGGIGSDTVLVTVVNLAPVVDAGDAKTSEEGEIVAFHGHFTDVGILDTHNILWDFGDGTDPVAGTLDPTHTYADDGTYTVTLTVTDDDGGVGTDTFTMIVFNKGPWVYAGPLKAINEGDTVSFSEATFSDVLADVPPSSIVWDFGDGSPLLTGVLNPFHTYVDDGPGGYTARLTVNDGDGGVVFDEVHVIVRNVTPTVIANVPDEDRIEIDTYYTFSGSIYDPGITDTHSIMWDFGDGYVDRSGSLTPSHKYTESGIYTVSLIVHDDDGAHNIDLMQMTVYEELPVVNNFVAHYAENGLTSIKLLGPGKLSSVTYVNGVGYDFESIVLEDTTDRSALVLIPRGGHRSVANLSNMGDIIVNGSLGRLSAYNMNLRGDIQVSAGNLGSVILGALDFESSITTDLGGINSLSVKYDIEGVVSSAESIGRVTSRLGGLTETGMLLANNGDIGSARFSTDVDGMVLASESIKSMTSRSGDLTGTIRAGEEIGSILFNNIDSAIISSGGNIKAVTARKDIVDSYLLAAYDIGPDGLMGTADDINDGFNANGATIGTIKVHKTEGKFDGTFAMAGVKPYDAASMTMLAPDPGMQTIASFGEIKSATVGQVFFNGDPMSGIYGLFAATEPIGNLKYAEVTASGAPDFQASSTWY